MLFSSLLAFAMSSPPGLPDPLEQRTLQLCKPLCVMHQHQSGVPGIDRPEIDRAFDVLAPASVHRHTEELQTPVAVFRSAQAAHAGLTIQANVFGATNADTDSALQLAIDYVVSVIADPITVELNVYFGITNFGGTAPTAINVSYEEYREAMLADADPDDEQLLRFLPPRTVPVKWTLQGPEEQTDVITLTTANAKALGIATPESIVDANLFIGSLPDGDPADGIGNGLGSGPYSEFSLVDILVHEIGHALGFFSAIDFQLPNPSALDVFRFQRQGPFDPQNSGDFRNFPRAMWRTDDSEGAEQSLDFIDTAYYASNGTSSQSSHFEETGAFPDRVGVMESSLDPFETGYPDYFSQGDRDAFDAIGWDITLAFVPQGCNAADLAEPISTLDLEDIVAFVSAFSAGDLIADLAEPPSMLDLADIVAFVTAFEAGCP